MHPDAGADRAGDTLSQTAATAPKPTTKRPRGTKPSCESCYFGIRMLCALELGGPCSTFRPDSPHGLIPPSQPMLLIGADAVTPAPELAAAA
jgi:hypothetical protein